MLFLLAGISIQVLKDVKWNGSSATGLFLEHCFISSEEINILNINSWMAFMCYSTLDTDSEKTDPTTYQYHDILKTFACIITGKRLFLPFAEQFGGI